MSRITEKGQGSPFSLFQGSSDVSLETLAGARFDTSDGREFVLVRVGASAISQGLLVQSSAVVANHQNGTASTGATGATTLIFTPGATAVTANQYRGGFIFLNAGTGAGQTLKIASHAAANASTAFTLNLEDALVANTDATTKGCLLTSPYLDVVVNPTTPTGTVVGATIYPLTAGTAATASYGFVQSRGQAAVFSDSLVATVGLGVAASAATAGWSRSATGAGADQIGNAYQTAVTAESRAVWLDL